MIAWCRRCRRCWCWWCGRQSASESEAQPRAFSANFPIGAVKGPPRRVGRAARTQLGRVASDTGGAAGSVYAQPRNRIENRAVALEQPHPVQNVRRCLGRALRGPHFVARRLAPGAHIQALRGAPHNEARVGRNVGLVHVRPEGRVVAIARYQVHIDPRANAGERNSRKCREKHHREEDDAQQQMQDA